MAGKLKAKTFLILPAFFVSGWAVAQNPDNPPYKPPPETPRPHVMPVQQPDQPPATVSHAEANVDPAKVAEFQKRFQEGLALEKSGKLAEARTVFDGILADQPTAKASLLHAGEISYELGDLAKASEYLEKLRKVVPDPELEKLHEQHPEEFPNVLELLIQINQSLKKDVKAELLVKRLTDLRKGGGLVGLSKQLWFEREQIPSGKDNISINQFYDFTQAPNTVWMAEVFGSTGELKRRILLNYDAAGTTALRAKDPKYATTQVFTWFEHVIKNGKVESVNAYLQIFALPDYQKFRSALLIIIADPPKPIYTAPVDSK